MNRLFVPAAVLLLGACNVVSEGDLKGEFVPIDAGTYPTIDFDTSSGIINILAVSDESDVGYRADMSAGEEELEELKGSGLLQISCTNCSFELTVLDSMRVFAGTSSGDITAESTHAELTMATTSGFINGSFLGGNTTASATSTDIILSFDQAPTTISATNSTGGVGITVPEGNYNVNATSTSGGVSITGIIEDVNAENSITATSTSGTVTIRAGL